MNASGKRIDESMHFAKEMLKIYNINKALSN
jgi:hypothetical protein